MAKLTKEELWVFTPILCSVVLNTITSVVDLSDYLEGMLHGMAIMLLLCAVVVIGIILNRKMKSSKKSKDGNN